MWTVKPKAIPVIRGATGTISKSLIEYLSNIEESTNFRNCKKQPYWALHTYYGKY